MSAYTWALSGIFPEGGSIGMAMETYRGGMPRIGDGVFVHASATVIGDVVLEEAVSVWPGVVIRGDVNRIRVGAGSNIQDNSVLHVSHRRAADPDGAPVWIGRDVTVGHGVILHGCTVQDTCLVGMGSIVLDKAILETRIILGAGSLVPEGRVLESGWLYVGRPAKALRRLNADELEYLPYLAANYRRLAAEYLAASVTVST